MATVTEYFQVVDAGEGRWVVLHQFTGQLAGSLSRTRHGLILYDEDGMPMGAFATQDSALRALYDTE
ncbi:MAG: hypothetical protein JWN80_3108 [Microbacteriaceae bacterium]|jgi:hypothetical protein|nr:hypothetical protein [Microbacteriaceae bacterium]